MQGDVGNYDYQVDPDNLNTTYGLIFQMVPRQSRVLEIGCATGNLARALEDLKGCRVTGIDIDPAAVVAAQGKGIEALVADVTRTPLAELVGDSRFDAVILADVLEHLVDPAALLTRLSGLLQPNGRILVSFPNVTHIDVQLMLLQDDWRYVPAGILDRTHLRFFSIGSFSQMAAVAGYEVSARERVHREPLATEVLEHGDRLWLAPGEVELVERLNRLNPNSTVYQYVLELKPSSALDPSPGPDVSTESQTVAVSSDTAEPGISFIVARRSAQSEELEETLYSLAGVVGVEAGVVLVLPRGQDLGTVRSLIASLEGLLGSVTVIEADGDSRSDLLNAGLESVSTEYACFLGEGCVVYPTFGQSLVARLEATPSLMAAYGALRTVSGKRVGTAFHAKAPVGVSGHSFDRALVYAQDYIALSALLLRLPRVRSLGLRFREDVGDLEGWAFVCDLASSGTMDYVDQVVVERRVEADPVDGSAEHQSGAGHPTPMHPTLAAALGAGRVDITALELAELGARIKALEAQVALPDQNRARLELVLHSRSWRLTRPLRRVTRSTLPE